LIITARSAWRQEGEQASGFRLQALGSRLSALGSRLSALGSRKTNHHRYVSSVMPKTFRSEEPAAVIVRKKNRFLA
jgi:hypothetical protein